MNERMNIQQRDVMVQSERREATGADDKKHLSESRLVRSLSRKEQAENERLINYFRIGQSSSFIQLGRLSRTPTLWLGA